MYVSLTYPLNIVQHTLSQIVEHCKLNYRVELSSVPRLNDYINGKATVIPCSGQSLKAIVQVEVEAIAEVTVNAWPFQCRQVDT